MSLKDYLHVFSRIIFPVALNDKRLSRPSASNLGVPIYHRRRRDWHDDQKLIVELAEVIKGNSNLYDINSEASQSFLKKTSEMQTVGFQENADAMLLAIWIRESLVKLSNKHGNYDLRVHKIEMPNDFDALLSQRDNHMTKAGFNRPTLSLSTLFPDRKLRGFALERIQVLHRGDIVEYLSSLISREKDSLLGYSATIMDLIHICQHKLKTRNIPSISRFCTDECDIWVPSLKLGIDVRNAWNQESEENLINLLHTTINKLKAEYLAIVCPDDLSDLAFHALREIERNSAVSNLSIIRAGDFGKYLDRIIEIRLPDLKRFKKAGEIPL